MLLRTLLSGNASTSNDSRRRAGAATLLMATLLIGAGFSSRSLAQDAPNATGPHDAPAPFETAASEGVAGTGFVEFRIGYYDNDDSGDGNPFLDEQLTVIEPVFIWDYNVTDTLATWLKISYDRVSSASIDRLSNFPDQSGASGDNYVGLVGGVRYKVDDDTKVGGFAHFSTEYDYTSIGLGGDITQDLADKNATIKWSANAFFDTVDVIQFNGVEMGDDDRFSLTSIFNWYQIIDPRTHGEFGATVTFQEGFLETAYNAVVIENPADAPNPNLDNMARGTEITEELPDTRVRMALHGKVRRAYDSGTSLEWGSRIYSDSWGINSLSVEPRIYQWLVDDVLFVRGRYRFYMQTAADDYDDNFFTIQSDRTQDSDLADFTAHTFGVALNWLATESTQFDVALDYIARSDGIDQIFASIGLRYDF